MVIAALIALALAAQHNGRSGPIPAVVIPADEPSLLQWIEQADGTMQLLGE